MSLTEATARADHEFTARPTAELTEAKPSIMGTAAVTTLGRTVLLPSDPCSSRSAHTLALVKCYSRPIWARFSAPNCNFFQPPRIRCEAIVPIVSTRTDGQGFRPSGTLHGLDAALLILAQSCSLRAEPGSIPGRASQLLSPIGLHTPNCDAQRTCEPRSPAGSRTSENGGSHAQSIPCHDRQGGG